MSLSPRSKILLLLLSPSTCFSFSFPVKPHNFFSPTLSISFSHKSNLINCCNICRYTSLSSPFFTHRLLRYYRMLIPRRTSIYDGRCSFHNDKNRVQNGSINTPSEYILPRSQVHSAIYSNQKEAISISDTSPRSIRYFLQGISRRSGTVPSGKHMFFWSSSTLLLQLHTNYCLLLSTLDLQRSIYNKIRVD